ncbi:Outer membrane protein OprG, partial [Pseudomonas viridiflava]
MISGASMNKHLLRASVVALAIAAPVAAHAYEPGDFIVRAGVAHVQPNEDSGEVRLDGAKVSGTKATVDGENQLGLTFAYMLTQ